MASNNKKVTLDVAIQTQEEKLDKLDKELENIKQKTTDLSNKKLQLKIEADTNKLKDVDAQIKKVESELKQLKGKADVDDSEVQGLQSKLQSLQNQKISIQADIDKSQLQIDQKKIEMQVAVEKSQLEKARAEADAMDGQEIHMALELAMQNFSQGIASCKQGVQDLYDNIKQVEQAGIQSEQNLAFLSLNMGAEKARDTFKEISDIVATMPGDDNTMRSVLSTAQALGNNLNTQEMKDAAATMADYMAGSATMGKMAVESQQDIMKYLLDGNTAELERGSIVSAYVDKLKDAKTFQERQKAMQEVLNQLGYGGISQMDTMLNKQAEWEGMMYNSKDALSSMWLNAEKGAMDYILKLNEASNGLVGMGIVAGQMVLGPLTDIMTGLGQVGVGVKTLKEAADLAGIGNKLSNVKDKLTGVKDAIRDVDLSGKFSNLKSGLTSIATSAANAARSIGSTLKNALVAAGNAAKSAVVWLARTSKELLVSAANAMKSAAAWLWDNAVKAASTAVTKLAAAAQWLLNIAMSANPIVLVTLAIVALIAILGYLYFNNEQVRAAVDGLGQTLMGIGQTIYGYLVGAIEWLGGAWQNTVNFFTNGANAINGAFEAVSQAVQGTAQWIWDSLIAAFEYLNGCWQNTVAFFTGGGQAIQDALGGAFQWLTDTWNNLVNLFNTYAPLVAEVLFVMATGGLGAIVLLVNSMMGGNSQLGAIFNSMLQKAISFGSNLVSRLGNAARNAVSNFANGIGRLGDALRQELEGMLSDAANFVGRIGQIMWNAAVNAWNNFLNGLQRHSPGIMMREFKAEMLGIVSTADDTKDPLASSMYDLAAGAVKSWGNPNFRYSLGGEELEMGTSIKSNNDEINRLLTRILEVLSNQRNTGNVTFNHYGDTDDEDKMYRILEFIQRAVDWDNETAGRKVGGA